MAERIAREGIRVNRAGAVIQQRPATVVTVGIDPLRTICPKTIRDDDNPPSVSIGDVTVTAGTFTTVIVFLPNIFGAQNQVTIFLAHVAYAITIALLASLLIARTLIPLLTLRLKPPPPPRPGDWLPRLTERYAGALGSTLRHRWRTFFVVLAVAASVAIPARMVQIDMNAETEDDAIRLRYQVHGEYTLEKVREAVDVIEEYLYANRDAFEIDAVYSTYSHNVANSTLLLRRDRRQSNREIREAVRAGLPLIAIGSPAFEVRRDGQQESVRLRLLGESSERLYGLSREVARVLASVEGITDVRSQATAGTPELRVTGDRDRAMLHGFSTEEVAQAVSVAMRGENLREMRGPEGEVAMRLELQNADRQTAAQLANLSLMSPQGERVALAALADFAVAAGPRNVEREERRTGVAIEANLEGISVNEARRTITEVMNQIALPAGYSWTFGQAFQSEDETMRTMAFNMVLALALIVIVMAALFESTLYPVSIITSILFSFIGVFWFFLFTGTTFSFMAMIGLLVLMGIVVNNGIVLIDHVNNLRRAGLARDAAVIQGGRDRLRPILMTAATTILAMTPLAIGDTRIGGEGPPYYPMARAIIGGLALSTVISLFVVPYVYILLDDLREWSARVAGSGSDHGKSLIDQAGNDCTRAV
jgi:hydrophobic/amphiphilic exporter-1 (mainly G- bacteria), HAE1 family